MKKKKDLSDVANSVIERCAETLDTSIDALVEDFKLGWMPEVGDYSKKLVEFCSSKALSKMCCHMEETIADGSFSRFTYDMMLAWEKPRSMDEDAYLESEAKEKEERKVPEKSSGVQVQDDVPLFYSDLMPLLVCNEQTVGEEALVWFGSLLPLAVDVANARFAFEALTSATANRLHFPAYDHFLKEIDTCIKYLQKQTIPSGLELDDGELILHVDGTATTQRVVRHIGTTSWPGRLTLTNYALYFEASGAISYEDALKIDLSGRDVDHQVRRGSTGPWGAPIFDKAMIYESSLLSECLVFEFPEMTSSIRRDLWVALTKEVILLHQFLSEMNVKSPLQRWEMHCRMILGIVRLHAAREMLRVSPPVPHNFLIFTLFCELPKGDYVLEELSSGLKKMDSMHPLSASSLLKSFNISHPSISHIEIKEGFEEQSDVKADNMTSLDTTISQVRQEAKDIRIANAAAEGIKEEGIADSAVVLMELLSPLKSVPTWIQETLSWERPRTTLIVLATLMFVAYKEWIGYAVAALLLRGVGVMLRSKYEKIAEKYTDIEITTSPSDQTTMENIVSAQHTLKKFKEIIQATNIVILKIQSIIVCRAPKHTNQVMLIMLGVAFLLIVIPFKYIVMATILRCFTMKTKSGKKSLNEQGDRRFREWWNSIPVTPIRRTNEKS